MIFIKSISKFFLDTLFPVSCLGCEEKDVWLCDVCLGKIKILDEQVCPVCEKIASPSGNICRACRMRFIRKGEVVPLDSLLVASPYKKISKLIYLFKYNFVSDLSFSLGKLMVKSLLKNNSPLPDLILPVPLHSRRLRWRGFNQSELLAEFISQNITPGFPVPCDAKILIRQKNTLPQMKIRNYSERKNNISGAFALSFSSQNDRLALKNKTILLIDDVATTGATLFEIGRLLRNNGVRSVRAAVLARQEIKDVL